MNLHEQLKELEAIAFNNESDFIAKFCYKDTTDLIDIWFSANNVKYNYILYSGQHITNTITFDDFNQWIADKQIIV